MQWSVRYVHPLGNYRFFFLQKNQCFSSKKHLVIKKPRQVDDLFWFVYKNWYHFLFNIKKKERKKLMMKKSTLYLCFITQYRNFHKGYIHNYICTWKIKRNIIAHLNIYYKCLANIDKYVLKRQLTYI